MEIRLAQKSDAEALIKFNQSMALETEGKSLDAATLKAGVEAVFNDPKKGFYVVAQESQIAGGLMVTFEWSDWRNAWFWWIQSVYVLPDQRGRRIYDRMYEFVQLLAQNEGNVCGFRLYVERENVRAQKVYERMQMNESSYIMYEAQK